MWVLGTAFLVFFMNLGLRHRRVGVLPGEEHGQHPGEELHRLRRRPRSPSWCSASGSCSATATALFGTQGLFFVERRRQQPGHRRRLPGRLLGPELDRRPPVGQVLLPARLRGHRRDDRLRGGGRARSSSAPSSCSPSSWSGSSTRSSATGSGAAAGSPSSACSTSPARRSSTRSAAGRRWPARSCSGPRIGKYGKDGTVNPIPGHSIALGTIGVFVLWFGWFGFNPGSTMAGATPAPSPASR